MTFDARLEAHRQARARRGGPPYAWCSWDDAFAGKEGHGRDCDAATNNVQHVYGLGHAAGLAARAPAPATGDAGTPRVPQAGDADAALLEQWLNYRDHPWRKDAEVIVGYMPEHPRADTQPTTVVEWHGSFLRHSKGPRQGFFWDLYGDDFHTRPLALLALSQAPPHPRLLHAGLKAIEGNDSLESVTFTLPVRSSEHAPRTTAPVCTDCGELTDQVGSTMCDACKERRGLIGGPAQAEAPAAKGKP